MVNFSRRRSVGHFAVHGTIRRTIRVPFRLRWRAPDDLGTALMCFRRALRCYKRLAKLAPSFFDSAVVEREARFRKARRDWMALWEPALNKVYGSVADTTQDPHDEIPPLPPPRIQKAVNRELASWRFWMDLGHSALERYKHRRPHELVSFTRIVRMIEIGMDFARMAAGIPSGLEKEDVPEFGQSLADLERAYGSSSEAASPASSASREQISELPEAVGRVPSRGVTSDIVYSPEPDSPPTPAPPETTPAPTSIEYRRRDAWGSYARYLRGMT